MSRPGAAAAPRVGGTALAPSQVFRSSEERDRGNAMQNRQRLFAWVGILTLAGAVALPAAAQSPSPPGDTPVPPGRSKEDPVSKSGLVKLATETGVVVVQPSPLMVRVFKVGETVSVPRSAGEPASASPRK
jgi:hypothetical protein